MNEKRDVTRWRVTIGRADTPKPDGWRARRAWRKARWLWTVELAFESGGSKVWATGTAPTLTEARTKSRRVWDFHFHDTTREEFQIACVHSRVTHPEPNPLITPEVLA